MKKIIVIGAGILGASAAYHLARKGTEVILIDRYDKGQATDAAAGIVCPWLSQRRNKPWYTLVKNGANYYAELIKMLDEDGEKNTGYKKVGAIALQSENSKLLKLKERAFLKREEAPEIGEITEINADKQKELFPPLSDQYEAVHVSGGARVNGGRLRLSLINAAQKHGARIINGSARLLSEDQKVIGAEVNGEHILADEVIAVPGVWAKELLSPLQIDFQVFAQKAQIIHLKLQDERTGDWPVIMPPNNQYMLAFENGKIVAGATHEDLETLELRVTAGGVHDILTKALQIAPGLEDAELTEVKVGFRPHTPGFLPVFGRIPEFKGILTANGLGASGLTAGPYVGKLLAQIALGEEAEVNLEDYDVSTAIKTKE
ncbi:NAD(P)/FAD-dependent oxidoreductase [Cytobacillus gottheilii]|uniref:NAD(P)/FAD-dependent oxidoreductase n=1 Tax=Cytobacillus gottheilii TaxID=859144 RepID=UPI0024959D8A|nr:FAD-dependent oxidoreductase [Cytobacillus gottheilii]